MGSLSPCAAASPRGPNRLDDALPARFVEWTTWIIIVVIVAALVAVVVLPLRRSWNAEATENGSEEE